MFDSIMNLGKGQLGQLLMQQTNLNSEQAEQAVPLAGESVLGVLKSELLSGNINGVSNLLGGNLNANSRNNPIVNRMSGVFISKMISRLGVPEQTAKIAAGIVIPFIISYIGKKTHNDGTDINNPASLLELLKDSKHNTNGGISNILSGLGSLFGRK